VRGRSTIEVVRSFPDALRRRLAGALPGVDAQTRMAPQPRVWPESDEAALRPAAALLLIYPQEGEWHVPLTVRGAGLRHHTSQVSLPGGRVDPGETFEQAALREAFEEIGVVPSEVEILGRLTPVSIWISNHRLHPVVGAAVQRPDFNLAAHEVDRLIEWPLSRLRHPDSVGWEQRERSLPPYGIMDVPYFDIADARVWGATAMVLSEFLALVDDD